MDQIELSLIVHNDGLINDDLQKTFAEEMGFEHLFITPLHLQANSNAERFTACINQ